MAEERFYYIHPDQLRVGLYVHLDLGWTAHPFTFSNFKIKDEEQIRQIRELNLKQLRYDPLRSDNEPIFPATIQANWAHGETTPSSPTPHDLPQRSDRLKQLNEVILNCEQEFSTNAITAREVVRNLSSQPQHSREEAAKLVSQMVDSVLTESDVAIHAISGGKSKHENYVHSLNVTVLALMLAKSLDMTEKDAQELGMAAIFHDVGKEDSPLNKSFVDLHCEIGARIALQAGLSERISRIILQHHEYVDGSGFPMHLKEEKIDPLARVLTVVNEFDRLCNPNNLGEAMTPYEALSHLFVKLPHKFDSIILRLLIKSLGVYPPGSIVQLSNGVYGIVMTVNPLKPMLPLVMLHVPEVARETPVIIDLGEETDLTIKKCLRAEQLPMEVFDYLSPRKRVCYYFLKQTPADESHSDSAGEVISQHSQTQTDPLLEQMARRA